MGKNARYWKRKLGIRMMVRLEEAERYHEHAMGFPGPRGQYNLGLDIGYKQGYEAGRLTIVQNPLIDPEQKHAYENHIEMLEENCKAFESRVDELLEENKQLKEAIKTFDSKFEEFQNLVLASVFHDPWIRRAPGESWGSCGKIRLSRKYIVAVEDDEPFYQVTRYDGEWENVAACMELPEYNPAIIMGKFGASDEKPS